jgi:hypothetical protein
MLYLKQISVGCKLALVFPMLLHQRSKDSAATDVQCYWRKPKSVTGTGIKAVIARDSLLKRWFLSDAASFHDAILEKAK